MKIEFIYILIVFCLTACVQKMGVDGHELPFEGRAAFLKISGLAPEGTVVQVTEEGPELLSPPPLSRELVVRGREVYAINCVPCHGVSGYGDGIVVQRGFLAPPSFHGGRLRTAPDQHFFDVITHGYGAMYSYGDRVASYDRWAVIQYVRALQLSQNTSWASLTPEEKSILKKEGGPEL